MMLETEAIHLIKLNGVDPRVYIADVLIKIANDHPNSQIDDLMPWVYAPQATLQAVA